MGNAKESPSCIVCHLLAICIAGERRTKHNLSLPTHPQAAYIQKIKIFWVKSTYTGKKNRVVLDGSGSFLSFLSFSVLDNFQRKEISDMAFLNITLTLFNG